MSNHHISSPIRALRSERRHRRGDAVALALLVVLGVYEAAKHLAFKPDDSGSVLLSAAPKQNWESFPALARLDRAEEEIERNIRDPRIGFDFAKRRDLMITLLPEAVNELPSVPEYKTARQVLLQSAEAVMHLPSANGTCASNAIKKAIDVVHSKRGYDGLLARALSDIEHWRFGYTGQVGACPT